VIVRQYVKDSLYDRISTRPFLNVIEKKWLAFQLLYAINKCHRRNVCHGDIKSENVMVTSWNWVLLADFASFKPTYLPEVRLIAINDRGIIAPTYIILM